MDYELEFAQKQKALDANFPDDGRLYDNNPHDSSMNVFYFSLDGKGYNGAVNRDFKTNTFFTGVKYNKDSRQLVKLKKPIKLPQKRVLFLERLKREKRTIDNSFVGTNAFEDLISMNPNDKIDKPLEKLVQLTARGLPFAVRSNRLQQPALNTDYTVPTVANPNINTFQFPPDIPNTLIGSADREARQRVLEQDIEQMARGLFMLYRELERKFQQYNDNEYRLIADDIRDKLTSDVTYTDENTPIEIRHTAFTLLLRDSRNMMELIDNFNVQAAAPAAAPAAAAPAAAVPASAPAMAAAPAIEKPPASDEVAAAASMETTPSRRSKSSKKAARDAGGSSVMDALDARQRDLEITIDVFLNTLSPETKEAKAISKLLNKKRIEYNDAVRNDAPTTYIESIIDGTELDFERIKASIDRRTARERLDETVPAVPIRRVKQNAREIYPNNKIAGDRYVMITGLLGSRYPEGKIREYAEFRPTARGVPKGVERLIQNRADIPQIISANERSGNQVVLDELLSKVFYVSQQSAIVYLESTAETRALGRRRR